MQALMQTKKRPDVALGLLDRLIRTILLLSCGLVPLLGQVTGTLRVLVTDTSNAIVAGSEVQAVNVDTNETFTGTTNTSGYAVFTPIPRGTYTVHVASPGFASVKVDKVVIDTDQNRQVPVQLAVASVSTNVEVSAVAVALQTEDASKGGLVTGDIVTDMPLSQRRYTDLALLVPGAVNPSNAASGQVNATDVLVNGGRIRGNNFQLDGSDNNGPARVGVLGTNVIVPPPDAVTEFKIQTGNFSAEFGLAIGAVISVSLKSGTNQIHGAAWEFDRTTEFAANSWQNNLTGLVRAPLRWDQPGGLFGGALIKNKVFYFGDFEGFHQVSSSTPLATVPTAAERQGDYSGLTTALTDPTTGQPFPGNIIPTSRIVALGQKILNLYPQPTNNTVGSGGRPSNNYTTSTQTTLTTYKFDYRMDYNLSSKDHFFGRYSGNSSNQVAQAVLGAATGNTLTHIRNQQGSFGWTKTVSAEVFNELRWAYNNQAYDATSTNVGPNVASTFGFLGIPSISDINLPSIAITNYTSVGAGGYSPQFHHPWSTAFSDYLSIVRGRHLIKFGGGWTEKQDNFEDFLYRSTGFSFQGLYSGNAAAEVLLGLPQSVSAEGFSQVHQRQQIYYGFFQDQWKITPQLSLDAGIRYEYYSPLYGIGNFRNVNFDFAANQLQVAPGGQPLAFGAVQANNLYAMNPDRNNVMPRIGVAYQISKRLVFRAAFGMFYDSQEVHGTSPDSVINPPNVFAVTLQRAGTGPAPTTLSQPFPANILNPSSVSSATLPLNVFPQNDAASEVKQWNGTLQYQLTSDSTIEVGYLGNSANNLDFLIQGDNAPWGLDGTVPANRPYPQWLSMLTVIRGNYAWSKYNAFQAKYDRRGKYWSTLTSFTWASAIGTTDSTTATTGGDDAETVLSTPAGPVPIPDPAYANAFTRFRFTNGMTFKIPIGRGEPLLTKTNRVANAIIGGWQVSYILSAQSGLPLNVTTGTTGINPANGKAYTFFSSEGGGAIRPNIVGNPQTGISPSANRLDYLNAASFQLQPLNTPGDAARNVTWAPGLFNIDMTLAKNFNITERHRIQVRIEAFNVMNHTNYSAPNAVWGGTTFGQITTAGPNRVIQMGIKYSF